MDRLPTRVDKSGEDFASRKEHNISLIEKLSEKMEIARGGGGGKYVERHESRGKGCQEIEYRKFVIQEPLF